MSTFGLGHVRRYTPFALSLMASHIARSFKHYRPIKRSNRQSASFCRYPGNFRYLALMLKIQKTNAARLLDKAKIAYELVPYPVDEQHLDAVHIAEVLGENIAQVFKTLVLKGDKTGFFVCVVPGDKEVDLKMAAKLSGNKSCDLIHVKELLPATGYIRGGCSPIGMKKPFPTFIHETCIAYPYIFVSAGIRGLQLKINPGDLVRYVKADVAALF